MAKFNFHTGVYGDASAGGDVDASAQGEVVAEASADTATTGENQTDASGQNKWKPPPPSSTNGSAPGQVNRCGWLCAAAAVAGFLGGSILGKRLAGL